MRRVAIMMLLASAGLFAQRPVASPSGFGRTLFPGGGGPSSAVATPPAGFGRALFPGGVGPGGSSVGGSFVGGGTAVSQPAQATRGRAAIFAVPYSYGYGYYGSPPFNPNWNWGYGPEQNQAQYTNYVPPNPTQQDPPVVIVNQYFGADQAPGRLGSQTGSNLNTAPAPQVTAENQDNDRIFMIAMKDHSIYAASAYWVEDGTLNYITIQGAPNSVSLDLVDRELSQRLNRDRRVTFGLPAR